MVTVKCRPSVLKSCLAVSRGPVGDRPWRAAPRWRAALYNWPAVDPHNWTLRQPARTRTWRGGAFYGRHVLTSHLQEVPEQAIPCAGISTDVDAVGSPRLRRTLKLKDLLIYGIVIISPLAPMTIFGLLSQRGKGHVVTTILIAMVAMVFTGI